MPSPIFDAPLTSTLVPTTAGNPAFTFTRATTAYVADNEGILRQAIANESRFQGARRVRNFQPTNSQDITVGLGNTGNVTTTPTTVAFTLANGSYHYKSQFNLSTPGGSTCVVSAKVSCSVARAVCFRLFAGSGTASTAAANVALTSTPQRISLSSTATGAGSVLEFGVENRSSVGATDTSTTGVITFTEIQFEIVDGQSNQAPGDYVSVGVLSSPWHGAGVDGIKYFATVNANVVASNVVQEITGSLIPAATPLGFVAENAATNLCLQSQTLDAGWGVSSSVVTPNTQTAPDGTLTADTLADNTINSTHHLYLVGGITFTAAPYTFSVYMKAGTLPWMQLKIDDGTATKWANFNPTSGVVGNKGAAATATITALPNGWYRCSVTATTLAVVGYPTFYCNLTDVAVSAPSYIGTGQTMYLWGAQVEQSSDPSSYIPTTTAAVARNGDVLTYPGATNIDGATATAYAETYTAAAAAPDQEIISFSSGFSFPQYYNATKNLAMFSNGVATTVTANARTLGAVNRNASAWSGVTRSVVLNGGVVATGAYVAIATPPNISVGGAVTAGQSLRGSIRNVKFYAERLTDAQLVDLTEDGVLTPDVVPVTTQPGGIGRYRRRRIEVEIDGEVFPVASEAEGRELLLKAREAAKQAAQAAAVRAAAKAEKKTSPAAVERALALSTPRISLRADDRSEALAQAIQAQVDAAQAAIDEDYATARRMAYAYVRQRLQDEQRQRELAADEEEVIAMILRLP